MPSPSHRRPRATCFGRRDCGLEMEGAVHANTVAHAVIISCWENGKSRRPVRKSALYSTVARDSTSSRPLRPTFHLCSTRVRVHRCVPIRAARHDAGGVN